MKSTSLSVRVWKNNRGTEIITLHSALGFNTFLIEVSLAGWISVILDALLIKASHAGMEKKAFYYNICMRHGERETYWRYRLTSYHISRACRLNCKRLAFQCSLKSEQRKNPNKNDCNTVTVLNILHGNMWISGSLKIEKGEGCICSLSQFKNELRLSCPGPPWGDPSEKD